MEAANAVKMKSIQLQNYEIAMSSVIENDDDNEHQTVTIFYVETYEVKDFVLRAQKHLLFTVCEQLN